MAELPSAEKEFYISDGGATEGPFNLASLRSGVASGRINSQYQVWNEAEQEWAPFSLIEPLLRPAPSQTAAGAAKGPVRVVRPPPTMLPGQEPMEGEPIGKTPGSFEPTPSRTDLQSAAPLKNISPRQMPTQRPAGTSTFDQIENPQLAAERMEAWEGAPPPREIAEAPAAARRRNYSPQSAGGNVTRPFAQGTPKATVEEPAAAIERPAVEAREAEPIMESAAMEPEVTATGPTRSFLPFAAMCLGGCLLALLVLKMAGLVNFGWQVREENERLTRELAASREKVTQLAKNLHLLEADKQDYLERFSAAQIAVRNMRISVFSSTRRALQMGDRVGVDQRLFELDQLDKLVPENDVEQETRHELMDAYITGGTHSPPKPPPPES